MSAGRRSWPTWARGARENSVKPVSGRQEARRDVRAVLLRVELGVDADVLQVLEDELRGVHEDRGAVPVEARTGQETVRITGGGEQPLGFSRVVLVILRPLAELVDRERPLLERRGDRGVVDADAFEDGVDQPLAVHGERHRLADTDVGERLLVGPHGDVGHDVGGELGRPEGRALLLEGVLDLDPVRPVDRAGELPAEVVLAGEERRHTGGVVLVDEGLDAVDVRQAREEVVGVAHQRVPDVGAVAVEHVGASPDHGLGLLQIAELLDALACDDRHRHRVGDYVEEPDERLLEHESYRIPVERLDLVHVLEHVGVGVALDGPEAFDRVNDVVRGQLAAVDGWLVVPPDAPAELEHVGRLVGLLPGLGEVALDGEGAGLDARAGLVLQEAAVGERERDVGLEGDREHVIEVGRIPRPERKRPPALGRLGARPGRADGRSGQGEATELQEVATAEGHGLSSSPGSVR